LEIVELDRKIRDSNPGEKLPTLPISASSLPPPPAKRKSTFLNTLSRLASPTSGKSMRQSSTRRPNYPNAIPSGLPTPLTSPYNEANDPFTAFSPSSNDLPNAIVAPSATSTGLAAYLTTISNTPALRQERVWKRFVRVRTDDLESVRVERAIKRRRSDLAAHVGLMKGSANTGIISTAAPSEGNIREMLKGNEVHQVDNDTTVVREEGIKEEEEEERVLEAEVTAISTDDSASHATTESTEPTVSEHTEKTSSPIDIVSPVTNGVDEENPITPIASENFYARTHRSKSADPDKSSRISRAFTSSVSKDDSASSQTGDESSVSTTGGRPSKKRSESDPNKETHKKKSHRKVLIDDFEMMRVLGKGCAGKVLLVKHKSTTDLFALKAITKRHVLAHQELQHTLTEQAVLKRMAAESKDPFVVKLWWSFHDKENLFLVMVR
jgi:hypothetical protein